MLTPTLHKHLGWMCDLETLATENSAVIPEVSIVAFEVDTGKIVKEFTYHLSVDEQARLGRKFSSGTLAFWLTQSEEARNKLLLSLDEHCQKSMNKLPLSIDYFLAQLREDVLLTTIMWEKENASRLGFEDRVYPEPLVYGNGPRFDMGKIADLYEKAGIEKQYPWGYSGDICVRTLHRLAPHFKYNEEFVGIPHFGLDDCKHQIKYVTKVYQAILEASNK